jgi:hypothetical protein
MPFLPNTYGVVVYKERRWTIYLFDALMLVKQMINCHVPTQATTQAGIISAYIFIKFIGNRAFRWKPL